MTDESTRSQSSGGDASSLRGLCGGAVYLPGDVEYEAARVPWAFAADQRPAAVALPADADDVADVVRAAGAAGLRVAPQGTGHNPHPLGDLSGAVLLRTSRMAGVEIDPVARTARVQAGTLARDVVEAAGPHGLAALHGSSPDVGVVGFSLSGGFGWYSRALGLAANSVTAVELVTADGSLIRADAEHETDLFWAVRGGGGNFGVVTALEFTLYPIETAYAGMLVWDWQHAHRVLSRWAEWTLTAPDVVTTSYRHLQYPPVPEIPEPFRGRQLVVIDGAVLADDAHAKQLLAPLRELGPELDTFARVPAASLVRLHMDPEQPTPGAGLSAILTELPPAAVERLVETAGPGSGTSLFLAAELRQLGGALGRTKPGSGALGMLDGQFVLLCGGIMLPPELAPRTLADCDRLMTAMAPQTGRQKYLNFEEDSIDTSAGYDGESWQRLRKIRAAVDPSGLFQANHEIPTA